MSIVTNKPRVLFVSWHFYHDQSNGAAISARELLLALSERGWEVKTFCGPCVDNPDHSSVYNVLSSFHVPIIMIIITVGGQAGA